MISSQEQALDQATPVTTVWKRAHPAFMLTALLRNLRGFIFPLVIILIGNSGRETRTGIVILLGVSAVILLLSGIGGAVQWWFYRYALMPDRLLVHSGIVFKQERAVPYQRIQTVDLDEAPLDRIFGVARMKVETASGGSGESEVELKAVKREEALVLREHLLRARQAVPISTGTGLAPEGGDAAGAASRVPANVPTTGELVRKLSFGDLLLAGATSGTIGPAAAVIGVAIQFADEILPEFWWSRVPWQEITGDSPDLGVIAGALLFIAFCAWLLAIGGTVLTYYGFELRRDADHLLVQYGLLDRRRTTIPIRRIQAVRVEEGLLRQPFGFATVKYQSAGRAGSAAGGSGVLFPMLPRKSVEDVLASAAPGFATNVDRLRLEPLPERSLVRYVVGDSIGSMMVVALGMYGIRWWRDSLPWWGYLPLLVLPVVVLLGWLSFRDAGWKINDQVLILRTRRAARSTLITPRQRIQYRQTTADPLQRRANLLTLHVAVASGGLGGHHMLRHIDRAAGEYMLRALNPRMKVPGDRIGVNRDGHS